MPDTIDHPRGTTRRNDKHAALCEIGADRFAAAERLAAPAPGDTAITFWQLGYRLDRARPAVPGDSETTWA